MDNDISPPKGGGGGGGGAGGGGGGDGGGDMTQSQSRPRDDQQHFLTAYPHSLHSDADFFGVCFLCTCAYVSLVLKPHMDRAKERERETKKEKKHPEVM